MTRRRMTIAAGAALVIAGGSAGAIAATSGDERKKAEQAVLADAAKRLETTPEKLRSALGAALDAQLDQAVEDGRLTRERADAIKKRRSDSGLLLPGFGRPGHGPNGFGHRRGGPGGRAGARLGLLAGAARALGISERSLHERLHDGRTLAQIAKARGKDLETVKAAARKAAADRLDQAVKAGRLTASRRDRILERVDAMIDRLATDGLPRRGRHFRGGPPGVFS